jgi:hypothetical protein
MLATLLRLCLSMLPILIREALPSAWTHQRKRRLGPTPEHLADYIAKEAAP